VAELFVTGDMAPFPPVLLVESMAQLGGVAAGQVAGVGGVLAAVTRGQLPPDVPPGKYTVSACIIKSFGTLHMVAGEVRRGEEIIAAATLTLAVATT
jgi:3-hydroxyacyl-[acyl-carrier-protein] dehydratase